MVSLVLMVVMALCMLQAVSMAAPVTLANATMAYVGTNGAGYEYNVSVTVTATGSDEVSILMFGKGNNSAFVTGDTVNLAVGEAAADDYYVYYVDQAQASSGTATFNFHVVLPDVATSTAYYIWAGSTTMDLGQMDKTQFAAHGVAFKVTNVTASSNTVVEGSALSFDITLKDVFGDAAASGVDVLYSSDNGTTYTSLAGNYENGTYTATAPAAGNYTMIARVTRAAGVYADSTPVAITVTAAEPDHALGDVDGDTYITTFDAVKALQEATVADTLSAKAKAAADVNGDKAVTSSDAVAILRHAARIEFFVPAA